MISKKERLIWLAVIFLSVVVTFLFTVQSAPTEQIVPLLESPVIATNTVLPRISDTPTFIISTATSTPIPCISSYRAPITDFEKMANEWFESTKPEIPNRNEYELWSEWKGTCRIYQDAVTNNESWILDPISVALMTLGPVYNNSFLPDQVLAIARPEHSYVNVQDKKSEVPSEHNILTVVFSISHLIVYETEIRVDLIRENEVWQIIWAGSRRKCYSNNEQWGRGLCE